MSFQRVRDPLHNLIEFEDNLFERRMWKLIQTRPFQRLRRIKQLGFSDAVYPGATHTRFAHSIGVFHAARRMTKIIKAHLGASYDSNREERALAAALLHDVGHGAFSHAFEAVGKRLNLKFAKHERVSDALIRDGEIARQLQDFGSGFASDVANLIGKQGQEDIYSSLVSSQFDADRLDYMQRDRLMTGTHHGAIDFDWLLSNLQVSDVSSGVDEEPLAPRPTFVLGPKATYAAETYLLSLFQMYPTVYFHKATRGLEKIFSELLFQIVMLVRDGSALKTGLPKTHPILQFAKHPEKLENALALDDTVIIGALELFMHASDSCVRHLAERLKNRDLMRCIDIREEVKRQIALAGDPPDIEKHLAALSGLSSPNMELALFQRPKLQASLLRAVREFRSADLVDKACVHAFEALSRPDNLHDGPPRVLLDDAKRSPYKVLEESSGPLEQILIKGTDGTLRDVTATSSLVAAVPEFRLVRAYVDRKDDHSEREVQQKIKDGVDYALAS